MSESKNQLLYCITELQFTCIDLNLYLDTHPYDEIALSEYNFYTKKLFELKEKYNESCGPLLNFGGSKSDYPFQWIVDKWPWEI